MKSDKRIKTVLLSLILILIGLLAVSSGCVGSPIFDLVIENQTDQVLTIYMYSDTHPVGKVEPGKTIITQIEGNRGEYPIKAKNVAGEVVFSETYSFKTNLQRIDGRVYKAVIPPLGKGPESSDNVTAK